ncbi:hypothetical protein FRC01_006344 [Tulasnella sp. 417]|nr:hypothetical protein FRC01_006344 [Tulasnella sp. 417]
MTSRHIHLVFKSTSARFRADYIITITDAPGRYQYSLETWWRDRLETWLRYGICDFEVLQHLIKQARPPRLGDRRYGDRFGDKFELPKRILRSFASAESESQESRLIGEVIAMGFLRYLLRPIELPGYAQAEDVKSQGPETVMLSGNSNSHDGYFLRRAVQLGHEPLVDLLLAHGCDPLQKAGLAVTLAIRSKDERMVRKLISKNDLGRLNWGPIGRHLLAYSAQVGARDISKFFIEEMRIAPNPETVKLLNT